jgi:hypothetical protein
MILLILEEENKSSSAIKPNKEKIINMKERTISLSQNRDFL